MRPLGAILIQPLRAVSPRASGRICRLPSRSRVCANHQPTINVPAPSRPPITTVRRRMSDTLPDELRRAVYGLADLLVGAATTDVGQLGIDLRVRRTRIACEQRGGGHDEAGLAI